MSGARPDTWMPFYVNDYLGDTMHLTTEQHGAYLLLLFACWRRGGTLPDDDAQLATIARLPLNRWRAMAALIRDFFLPGPDGLGQKRCSAELSKAKRLSETRAQNGKQGGRPKANGKLPVSKPKPSDDANPKLNETPLQSQLQTGSDEPVFSEEADASSAVPAAGMLDLKRELWKRGKALMEAHGIAKIQAGQLLGRWRKTYSDPMIIDALSACEAEAPSDPVAYITACLERRKTDGRRHKTTRFEAALRAAERLDELQARGDDPDDARALLPAR